MRVRKILDYEQAPYTKTWQKDTLLVADNQIEDYERVFETRPDGRVGMAYPRPALDQLLDELPTATKFLQQAAGDGARVALVE